LKTDVVRFPLPFPRPQAKKKKDKPRNKPKSKLNERKKNGDDHPPVNGGSKKDRCATEERNFDTKDKRVSALIQRRQKTYLYEGERESDLSK